MISPIKLSQYCLAAFTLGCLGAATLSSSADFHQAHSDSQSPSSHRGSGRVVTQVPQQLPSEAIHDYRGTGRLYQDKDAVLSHRGSGRGPEQQQPSISYRGSGRAVHSVMAWQEAV
ncbi:MAG: hypothetical protein F6K00_11505 [Leptolyngbya sp. SIOISBB]|nr:hypothetical protein [Leptolyngbya sp. SIOISBB]